MEFNVQLPSDAIERRRLQNRLAQRKFRQKRGQRRGLVAGDDVSADALPNPAVAIVGSQTLNPSQSPLPHSLASDGDSTVPAFPSDVDPLLAESSHVAPPDLDDVDLWDFGSADAFLPDTFAELVPSETILPSPSQLLDELPADRTPSSATRVASSSTDDPHVSPTSDSNSSGEPHPAPVRKPLRYRRSAQLKEGLEPARQSEADDEGWLGSLHIAAAKGSERMVEVLLQQAGLDRDERDSDGRTPLMHAAIRGHAAVARILLARGARLGAVDKDARSALHWAVLYRRDDILGILLEKSAFHSADGSDKLDVDAYDDSGCTPLHMAIHQDSEVAVKMLLGAGASLNSKAQKCPFARRLVALGVS
ncbi:hypothetical protein Hte_001872 [Hypoxylon texense]